MIRSRSPERHDDGGMVPVAALSFGLLQVASVPLGS